MKNKIVSVLEIKLNPVAALVYQSSDEEISLALYHSTFLSELSSLARLESQTLSIFPPLPYSRC